MIWLYLAIVLVAGAALPLQAGLNVQLGLGFAVHPVNAWRIAGAVLLVVGAVLIRKF